MSRSASEALLYTWYGDDFTGSTDVLEALAVHDVPAVLFTDPPDEPALAGFAHCRAIGIAGESRSRSPQWMDEHLPKVFAAMRSLGAPVNHYKVCSTFDSAPHTGSIGRAMELGAQAFASAWIPIMAAAPHLGRFVLFSNLFARAQDAIYRIDRHPTMSRHPVTPMDEADLRLHLARQTSLPIGSVDLLALRSGGGEERLRAVREAGARAIVFDGLDEETLRKSAALLWAEASAQPVFAVGSSGLTYGLLRLWQSLEGIRSAENLASPPAVDHLLVLSGSCSPVTAGQIQAAQRKGFRAWCVRPETTMAPQAEKALKELARGGSVVLYTALGIPDRAGAYGVEQSHALGELLRELLLRSGVRRLVIAGGDTASHAVRRLGAKALTFAAPLTPGAPLCRLHVPGSALDGLEVVLKGGQIGPEDFLVRVRDGR